MNPTHSRSAEQCLHWARDWHAHRARSGLEANLKRTGIPEEAFWTRYATWVDALKSDGYPGLLLDRVASLMQPGDSVLDIGAGTGTFAIPLSRIAQRVTAVEPSPALAAHLRSAAQLAAAENIAVIEKRWEDIDSVALGSHSIVVAAHSLQMTDIAAAIHAMCELTSRCLVLIHTAGHNLAPVLQELFGIEPGPDYRYLERILYGMGYRPEVELIARECEVRLDMQLDIFRYNPGLDTAQCEALSDYAGNHGLVVLRNGERWLRRTYTDALISLKSI